MPGGAADQRSAGRTGGDVSEILPTGTCFDDALDYLAGAVAEDLTWAEANLRLVHAICLVPCGPQKGQLFCHGWVEEDRDIVIQSGVRDGKKGYFGVRRRDHYAHLSVQVSTVYTVEEAWARNRESNHFGPWEASYRDLCRQPGEARVVFRD